MEKIDKERLNDLEKRLTLLESYLNKSETPEKGKIIHRNTIDPSEMQEGYVAYVGKYNFPDGSFGSNFGADKSSIRDSLSKDSVEIAKILDAFASPERLEIIKKLMKKHMTAKELMAELNFNTTGKLYHHLSFLDKIGMIKKENEIYFKVSCSKGTYIRSLCEDIAQRLDTVGYMKELNRIKVGRFRIEDAITINQIEENDIEFIKKNIITMKRLFEDKEKIELNNETQQKFLNGVKIYTKKQNGVYNIYNKEKYIGIGTIKENILKRDIIEKEI